MKRITFFIAASVFFISATLNTSAQTKKKRYDVKSGKIVYKISGDMMNGKRTMWWDDYGLKQAEYESSTMGIAGFEQKTNKHTITIINDQFQSEIYICDPAKGTGTHMTNDFLSGEKMEETDWQNLGEKMITDMGGVKVGQEKIAGVMADKWEIKNAYSTTWVWKYINVKNEVTMGMKVVEEATSIETDIAVSADHFNFKKYKIEEKGTATDIMEMLNQGNY